MGEHQVNKENKQSTLLKNRLSNKEKVAVVLILLLGLMCACISIYRYYGLNMSKEERREKIYATLDQNKDYEEATKMAEKYFKKDTEELKKVKGLIDSYKIAKVTNSKEYQSYVTKQNEAKAKEKAKKDSEALLKEMTNSIKIEKVEWKNDSGNYGRAVITVKNTGNKNIRYVKVNIFMYDSNNNIIDSYWTNSSSLIKPGAKLELEKMIPYKDNYENATMNAEIADMRFD